jgi:HK97 family phage major capsid protein
MSDEMIYYGDAVKATQQDDGTVKLGGYLVRFSDAAHPDLTGDYFTKSTDFGNVTKSDGWFNHRMPVKFNGKRVEYKEQLPDATLTFDDTGVFAEIVLGARNEYEKEIAKLGIKGKLGWSSGTASHLVDRKQVGNSYEITRWKLGLDASLTPTPAEPRLSNRVLPIKSILETSIDEEENNMSDNTKADFSISGTVSLEAAQQAAEQAVAKALAQRDAEAKALQEREAEKKAAEEAGYQKAIADLKERRAPAFNTKTVLGFSEEKDAVPAFKHWLSTGEKNGGLISPDSVMENMQSAKAAWNVTTGSSGGYLVPDPLYNQIIAKRNLASWVRQAPVQKFTTASDHLLVPRESTSNTAFTLTAEAAAYTEDEATVSQKDLILYKYTKMQKVSEEFLQYNSTNFEQWISEALGRAEAVTENTIFTNGTGSGEPEGVVTNATASAITIKTSAQLNPEDLTAIIGKLNAGYNVPSECGFLMANASKWYIKNAILAGPFAYASNNGSQGAPDFFGYTAYVSDDVTSYTSTSAKVLLFGNMTYYGVIEKPGMMVQRNPYLYMANGQVGIFASIFRGGGILQTEAFYTLTGK